MFLTISIIIRLKFSKRYNNCSYSILFVKKRIGKALRVCCRVAILNYYLRAFFPFLLEYSEAASALVRTRLLTFHAAFNHRQAAPPVRYVNCFISKFPNNEVNPDRAKDIPDFPNL